jgi:hypothetical protein
MYVKVKQSLYRLREAVRAAGGLGYAPTAFTSQEIYLVFISVREPQCGGRDYVSEKFQ